MLVLAIRMLLVLRKGRHVLERAMEERRERLPRLTFRGLEIISPQRLFTGALTLEKIDYFRVRTALIGGSNTR